MKPLGIFFLALGVAMLGVGTYFEATGRQNCDRYFIWGAVLLFCGAITS